MPVLGLNKKKELAIKQEENPVIDQPEAKLAAAEIQPPLPVVEKKKRGRKPKAKEDKLHGRWIKCTACGACNYFNGSEDMKTTKLEKREARLAMAASSSE